jgi:uncharacterized membrane protein
VSRFAFEDLNNMMLTALFEGVYAISTTTIAKEIPSAFFRVLGTIFSVAELLLWVVVASGTLYKAYTGEMFFAPCLKDIENEESDQSKQCRFFSWMEVTKKQ